MQYAYRWFCFIWLFDLCYKFYDVENAEIDESQKISRYENHNKTSQRISNLIIISYICQGNELG